ncbi:hypothetical protein P7K49_008956, partial [Saguinus oedipus]
MLIDEVRGAFARPAIRSTGAPEQRSPSCQAEPRGTCLAADDQLGWPWKEIGEVHWASAHVLFKDSAVSQRTSEKTKELTTGSTQRVCGRQGERTRLKGGPGQVEMGMGTVEAETAWEMQELLGVLEEPPPTEGLGE